jgi:hypothetical protein
MFYNDEQGWLYFVFASQSSMAGRHHYQPKDPQQQDSLPPDPDHSIGSGRLLVVVLLDALEIKTRMRMRMRRMMSLLKLVPLPISNPPKWITPLV